MEQRHRRHTAQLLHPMTTGGLVDCGFLHYIHYDSITIHKGMGNGVRVMSEDYIGQLAISNNFPNLADSQGLAGGYGPND
jgi:hypothetical protein